MPMYKLTPAFAPDFDVIPKKICYGLTPYHDFPSSASKTTEDSQIENETDPVKILEQKQKVLMDKLKAQAESLNKLLAVFGKTTETSGQTKKPEKKQPSTNNKAAAPAEPTKDAKKDKDAKKEARKAAKNDAKQKVASGDAAAPKGKGRTSDTENAWTVEDDRKTWTTGLSLTANIPTTLVTYPQEALGTATLTITDKDQKWAKALAVVGQKRKVAFTGSVSNKVGKDAKTTVTVKSGPSFSLVFGKTTIKSHQTAWKVLGAALGLYSRKSAQTFNSAHQALWLDKVERVLSGTGDLSLFERDASQFLARFDSLSSQWDVTVADVVFRSLLDNSELHSNNVEIWAKRIDALIS